ncbi:MAG: type II toxin-antitoxin system RelE/ParE family toxin [Desulfomicrobium sp.]
MRSGAIVRVSWLRAATRDLDAQMSYIARDDAELAREIYGEIRRRASELSHFPESGRPGRVPGTRELVLARYPYVLPYRVRNGIVEILRVFHTSQKMNR